MTYGSWIKPLCLRGEKQTNNATSSLISPHTTWHPHQHFLLPPEERRKLPKSYCKSYFKYKKNKTLLGNLLSVRPCSSRPTQDRSGGCGLVPGEDGTMFQGFCSKFLLPMDVQCRGAARAPLDALSLHLCVKGVRRDVREEEEEEKEEGSCPPSDSPMPPPVSPPFLLGHQRPPTEGPTPSFLIG